MLYNNNLPSADRHIATTALTPPILPWQVANDTYFPIGISVSSNKQIIEMAGCQM